ncbi:DUF3413 domain-containing protein [Salicola sp. Rm-C-2C1-2]|uniref:DUF3413 domain-containing protein n=1 Tax=Salicola sp. Rm-C-2C1-2 TaxID=3141321 RepID=UPI0032E4E6FE
MQQTQFRRAGQRASWTGWFLLINGILALLAGLRYLPWLTIPDGITSVYLILLYLAQFPLLALVVGLPLLAISLLPSRWLLIATGTLYATGALGLLLIDTVTYAQFRFHLSGFVLDMALKGGSQIFSFPWQMWAIAGAAALGLLLLELMIGLLLAWRRPRFRWLALGLAAVFAGQLTVHSWHAWADANHDSRITSITRAMPLYYGATAKRFMEKNGLVDPKAVQKSSATSALSGNRGGGQLNYPTQPLTCEAPAERPNVLMIAIDGARGDMVDPKWMPNIQAFAGNNIQFSNHYANGNATKPGIFTLFYSLPAGYWDTFTSQKRAPVMITRLQELDYELKIMGSAPLISPAFNKNVFASVENLRLETPGDKSWDWDIRITEDWLAFTEQQSKSDDSDPFFGFLFYDTPHGHRVPDDYPVKFQPYWDPVNKLALGPDFNPELMRNNYKSTLHFVDNQIGRVLSDLKERGMLASTIVMITGDHGQEFNEHGKNYWGHGSNFGQYQLHTPMIVHWPGHGSETHSYRTENFDVAPTIMGNALGCGATDPEIYATGNGLFQRRERDWSIAHSYMDYAVLLDDHRIVQHASGRVTTVDNQLNNAPDFSPDPGTVKAVLNEMSRFYR